MNMVLLKDFQTKFNRFFGIKPIIAKDGRAKIQNKEIYERLTENHTYYSAAWDMPLLNRKLLALWLRAYFDCDGWISVIKAKDRKIGLESINQKGILQIKSALFKNFGIESTVKKRKTRGIWSLSICGRDDIAAFAKHIGFLHPKKRARLEEALASYMNYEWVVPTDNNRINEFIKTKGRFSRKRGQIRFNSIKKKNLIKFKAALIGLGIKSRLSNSFFNGSGNRYYTLSINVNELSKLRGFVWDMEKISRNQTSRK
jgi:intein/homing endonuclease